MLEERYGVGGMGMGRRGEFRCDGNWMGEKFERRRMVDEMCEEDICITG